MQVKPVGKLLIAASVSTIVLASAQLGWAAAATTTTTLAVSSASSPVTTAKAGTVITLAATVKSGTAALTAGQVDGAGDLYIADQGNTVIRKVSAATGSIATVAGKGNPTDGVTYSGDGGPATSARLDLPYGVAVDSPGNIYIADGSNSAIRKVTASTEVISTVAGNGTYCYSLAGDGGPASSAGLCFPTDGTTPS